MENKSLRHFYVDCTNTYFDYRNDGISRVTRTLIELAEISREMGYGEVHPVVFCNDRFYVLPDCAVFKDNPFTKYNSVRGIRRYLDPARYWNKFLFIFSPATAVRQALAGRYKKLMRTFREALRSMEETDLSMDDLLVMPEYFVETQHAELTKLKKRLKLVTVIHDLIPITHPEYCGLPHRFNELCKFTAKNADMVVTVSKYTAACYEAYEKLLEVGGVTPGKKRIAWFHPGCELNRDSASPPPSAQMAEIFADGVPVYLVCGTIEPRKNHLMVLKVFEQLWTEGHAIKLLFVGRYGWKVKQTVEEMARQPERNRRFFWLSRAPDADLSHAYRHCHAVIFPSHVEGFGLPMVEALAAGKPVLFSRIKSFLEIVPEEYLVNSFDPDRPEELLSLLRKNIHSATGLVPGQFKPVPWREAVKQFYGILAEAN